GGLGLPVRSAGQQAREGVMELRPGDGEDQWCPLVRTRDLRVSGTFVDQVLLSVERSIVVGAGCGGSLAVLLGIVWLMTRDAGDNMVEPWVMVVFSYLILGSIGAVLGVIVGLMTPFVAALIGGVSAALRRLLGPRDLRPG